MADRVEWIRDETSLSARLREIGDGPLGLDTEADSLHHYPEKVCLIQLSFGGSDLLIDPLTGVDLSVLGPILTHDGLRKILHGADYDLRVLDRDFGLRVRGLFDTMVAARLAGETAFGLAGLLDRAYFGEALYLDGANPNQSLPLLFIELFPTWLAALIGIGVLSAIMSTADGLVVSSSQIIANDLYRRTIVPITKPDLSEDELDQRVLKISRISTVVVLLICMSMAWSLMSVNVSLIVWIGVGGMMASFAGPLVVGALWRGVTRHGAYAGLIGGFIAFLILHTQLLNPDWFTAGAVHAAVAWLHAEGPNPFSCAVMGEIVSVSLTVVVSKLTQPLPDSHLDVIFDSAAVEAAG